MECASMAVVDVVESLRCFSPNVSRSELDGELCRFRQARSLRAINCRSPTSHFDTEDSGLAFVSLVRVASALQILLRSQPASPPSLLRHTTCTSQKSRHTVRSQLLATQRRSQRTRDTLPVFFCETTTPRALSRKPSLAKDHDLQSLHSPHLSPSATTHLALHRASQEVVRLVAGVRVSESACSAQSSAVAPCTSTFAGSLH